MTSLVEQQINKKAQQAQTATLKLTPSVASQVGAFLATAKPSELLEALGSPLNVLFPQLVHENLQRFQMIFEQYQLRGRIYFAHKANRSDCIPRELSASSAHIDVSSIHELRHALSCGFAAARIQATGPKNTEFIYLCLQHDITISIDSLSELEMVKNILASFKKHQPVSVLLRVSGFKNRQSRHQGKASRFGIKYDDIGIALDSLTDCRESLQLIGFAFHLDTVSSLEKASAVESCLTLFEQALERDFEPSVLNIGGGFKVSYLQDANEWHQYGSAMREAALGTRAPITWQGNTFGLLPEKGVLRGNFNTYSFYDSSAGAAFLDEILSHPMDTQHGLTVARFLSANGIELCIEPGRALLDQVGVTLARVNSVRESSTGDTLVCLNMKRQDICFIDQEIFVDPIVLYQGKSLVCSHDALDLHDSGDEHPVYFAGNLCLESDLITRHQTYLPKLPAAGDLVAFINTAGYFMDFSASEAIMQPIARKIAVSRRNSCFSWALDEHYYPAMTGAKETL